MNPVDRERVKDLLAQAARLESWRRDAFIESAAGNAEIAAEALDLLHSLDESAFMSAPTGAGFAESSTSVTRVQEGPGAQIGRYKLLQLIGEGGFGSVFMAEQTEPVNRRVALKIIKAGMDTKQTLARFEAERQALAMMDHPNIARVLDAGATDNGRPYFVMELVRGEPVTKYCDEVRLPVRQRLELFRDVCNAVQHAHQKGIIHRDLKPTNVLVTVADGEPLPKVIDFGIAKATTTRLTDKTLFTELHQLIGTPEYMSPEQAEVSGVDIDTRSDIYSLGVLLYELLVGSTPLENNRLRSTSLAEIQRIIREEEPPRPSLRFSTLAGSTRISPSTASDGPAEFSHSSAINIARRRQLEPPLLVRTLRGDLDWIVMKCLDKDRRRRYPTASALADDVTLHLMNQPVSAIPPSAGYKLKKFVQRNHGAVLAGAVVTAVLVLGVIGTTLGMVSARRERRHAEQQKIVAEENAATARNQAARADREAEQARTVNEFMRDVLSSASPQNRGADVRLIDVLASASATASQRFAKHPLKEAQVRALIAEIYIELSMPSEAKAEYTKSLALWRENGSADDPQALTAESRYADLANSFEQMYEAEKVLAGLLPRMERVFGPDDPRTLSARATGAISNLKRGRTDEAERVLLELRAHPALEGEDGTQLRILHGLLYLCLWSSSAAPDRTEYLSILSQGEPMAREMLERSTQKHGPTSPVTLRAQNWLAEAMWAQGEYHAATEMCRAVLHTSVERCGECHQVRTDAMLLLAKVLTSLGEVGEPAELHLRRIPCLRQRYTENPIALLSSLRESLPYLERAGRATEGESIARELMTVLRSFGGGHDDVLIGCELYVARFASMQDRIEEAESIFQSLRPRYEQANSMAQARGRLFYSGQLVRRRQFVEAEQELLTAVELTGDVCTGTHYSHPDDIILGFIALYEAWGKPHKAEEYRRLRAEIASLHANHEGE